MASSIIVFAVLLGCGKESQNGTESQPTATSPKQSAADQQLSAMSPKVQTVKNALADWKGGRRDTALRLVDGVWKELPTDGDKIIWFNAIAKDQDRAALLSCVLDCLVLNGQSQTSWLQIAVEKAVEDNVVLTPDTFCGKQLYAISLEKESKNRIPLFGGIASISAANNWRTHPRQFMFERIVSIFNKAPDSLASKAERKQFQDEIRAALDDFRAIRLDAQKSDSTIARTLIDSYLQECRANTAFKQEDITLAGLHEEMARIIEEYSEREE